MGWNRMVRHTVYIKEMRNVLKFSVGKYEEKSNPAYLHIGLFG
jgi:hypothetical protein